MEFHYIVVGQGVSPAPGITADPKMLTPDKRFYKPGVAILDEAEAAPLLAGPMHTKLRRMQAGSHPARPLDAPAPEAPAAEPAAPPKPPAAPLPAPSAPAAIPPPLPPPPVK